MAQARAAQRGSRPVAVAVGTAVVIALLIAAASYTDWYVRIEGTTLDARFRLRPQVDEVPGLVTIDIDTESLEKEGAWPWPRDRHTRLVETTDALGARSLAFDIFFADRAPPPSLTRERFFELGQHGQPVTVDEFADADKDLTLGIARAGHVYLAQTFQAGEPDTQIRLKRDEERLRQMVMKGMALESNLEEAQIFPHMRGPDAIPLSRFAAAAQGVGCVQTESDPDGVTRHFPIFIRYDLAIEEGGELVPCLFPSMPFLMALHDLGLELSEVVIGVEDRTVTLPASGDGSQASTVIPINQDGYALINWTGDFKASFRHVPYAAFEQVEAGMQFARVKRRLAEAGAWESGDQNTIVGVLQEEYSDRKELINAFQLFYGADQYGKLLRESPEIQAETAVRAALGARADDPNVFAKQEQFFLNVAAHEAAIARRQKPGEVDDTVWANAQIVAAELERSGGVTDADWPLYFYPPVDVEGETVFAGHSSPLLEGATCFYGLTATGTHDLRPTPFNPAYPLLGVHPTVYSSIMSGQLLREMPRAWRMPIFIVLACLVALYSAGSGPARVALLTIGLLAAYTAGIHLIFVHYGWVAEFSGTVSTVLLTAVAVSYQSYRREEAHRKFIRGAFEQYMNPNIVATIADDPEGLKLGGVELDATAFFSDVEGFTTISEALSSQDLVALLNEYLTAMTEIVFQYDGLLDKYEGDAIIAIFGAPLQTSDHAVRACHASLDMQRKLVEMRKSWAEQGKHELLARIGINSGLMTVGNMGSTMRFDYTMMGDTVNLAARLEGANKQYGTYLMCSEFTMERCDGSVLARELDLLRVKGKNLPVRVHEVYGKSDDVLDTDYANMIAHYNEGLGLYKDRDFAAARGQFDAGLTLISADGPCQAYLQRCESYLVTPPPADWDGVFTMTTK